VARPVRGKGLNINIQVRDTTEKRENTSKSDLLVRKGFRRTEGKQERGAR